MPMTTDLPVGDLFEFIGDFRLNGDGPPTTGRMGLDRLQAILLGSTSLVGARIAVIESRLATAEGYTNQIASLATRITTLEGLAGISPGTDLAADGTAVRSTRYWGRPGEAIRTWTASIAATSAAAVPLTVGGAYSIVATTLGPALRITGVAAARPIAQVFLDDTQVEEFKATIKRGADDTTTPANPANNAPAFAFACFKPDGTDNGTVPLPVDPLTAAQGFKTFTFRASLVAGLGTVDLPAGTRRVNLIPGGKGTGSIDVVSVERSSQSLTSAPEMTDAIAPEDRIFILDDSAKLIKKLAPLTLAQYVEAYLAPPPVYWFKGAKVASKAEQTLVAAPAAGAIIQNLRVQNTSRTAYVAVALAGISPSLTDGGSYILGPGMPLFLDTLQQGRVSFLSDTEGSPISCTFTSTVNLDPNSSDRAAKHLARYGTAMTAPQSTAIGTLFNTLFDAGWNDLFSAQKGGFLWVGSAPGNFDGLINWTGTNNFARILQGDNNVYPDTSFAGTLFNGLNAIDSLVKPAFSVLPGHGMFSWTDPTLKSAAKVSMGNTVLRLNPDRSNGADSVYTGAGSSIISGIPRYGGLKGYVRRDVDNFRYYSGADFKQDVAKTINETTGGAQSIAIGALNTSSGLQFGETTPMRMAGFCVGVPTDDQVAKLANAFTAFHAALGA
ncbi:hypothetical protein [Methylobacterium sp. E-045]|uniref:hypothetical protein n=1 Tax=Methylobacterium sp. E-045 TaxID=2836575 RepID=UPI001FBBBAE7|nr:hypothetical protein [Methylobacterium sp. E-045]MCJ2131452.1 hypothetical protein [Methylobacterium sp. E-045]